MEKYSIAYRALIERTTLPERALEFIERFLTLDVFTQQLLNSWWDKEGSDRGAEKHTLTLSAAATGAVYNSLESVLRERFADMPPDKIEYKGQPVYVTRTGREISGTRKEATFRLHSHELDLTPCPNHISGEDAAYSARTVAIIRIYKDINLDLVEREGDKVIKRKGEPHPSNVTPHFWLLRD